MKFFIPHFILSVVLFSCGNPIPPKENITTDFDFSQFPVGKLSVGPIKIGDKISEIEVYFKNLEKVKTEAWDFGFDGHPENDKTVLFKLNSEPVIAFIPAANTDSIVGIIVLHPKFKTESGISPKMSVKEVLKVFPDALCYNNLMMGWEEIADNYNYQQFIFASNEEPIAEYPDIEAKAKPVNQKPTIDWICLFKEEIPTDIQFFNSFAKAVMTKDLKKITPFFDSAYFNNMCTGFYKGDTLKCLDQFCGETWDESHTPTCIPLKDIQKIEFLSCEKSKGDERVFFKILSTDGRMLKNQWCYKARKKDGKEIYRLVGEVN
ncbi:MAG: hypothetical protein ACKOXB_00500 [Flavobacteriales bacterium]